MGILAQTVFERFEELISCRMERTTTGEAYPNSAKHDRVSPKNHFVTAAAEGSTIALSENAFAFRLKNDYCAGHIGSTSSSNIYVVNQ